jgi:hypothetical protein
LATKGYTFFSPNFFIETQMEHDVHSRMTADARRIYAKVEVIYTDPL